MSILVRFTGAPSMTAESNDATLPTVQASGEWPPDGLGTTSLQCRQLPVQRNLGLNGAVRGVGQPLMPILTEGGVELAVRQRYSRSTTSSSVSASQRGRAGRPPP